jgi:small subunit ribosomal protein S16
MVVIRLSRGGTNKRPFYKIVVADRRASRDGCHLERVGFFNPVAAGKEKRLELNRERVTYWLSKGAQPSERVTGLLLELDKPEILEKRKAKNAARKARKKAQVKVQLEAETIAKDASKEEVAAESK